MYPEFEDNNHKLFAFRPNLALSDHCWKAPVVMKLATFWNPGKGCFKTMYYLGVHHKIVPHTVGGGVTKSFFYISLLKGMVA